jgi:hypothetical protein
MLLFFLLSLFTNSFASWEEGGRRIHAVEHGDSTTLPDSLIQDNESSQDNGLIAKKYCSSDYLSPDTTDSDQDLQSMGVTILKTPRVWGSNHDTIIFNTLMYNQQNLESIEFFADDWDNSHVRLDDDNPYSIGASLSLIVPPAVTAAVAAFVLYVQYTYTEHRPDTKETLILINGFSLCGLSISLGAKKMSNHIKWENRYGE